MLLTCLVSISFAEDTPAPAAGKPAIKFQVLKQRTIDLGNRSLILNRVLPPILPAPPTLAPPVVPTAAEIAAWETAEAEQPRKRFEILFLSTTVYDRKVTEVRWFGQQRNHKVFTNIDFNYLAGVGGVEEIETDDAIYMLMLGIANLTSNEIEGFNQYVRQNGWPKRHWKESPPAATFSKARSEYVVVEDELHTPPPAGDLAAFDALHIYFDANKPRLIEEHKVREAANAERQRWLEKNPPIPQDVVVHYWRKPSEQPKNRRTK